MPSMDHEYNQEYYKKNKDKLKKYYTEKIRCEICNSFIRRGNESSHKRTNKHTKNLEKKDR